MQGRKSKRHRQPHRQFERLEQRRLLDSAPIAHDDSYQATEDHRFESAGVGSVLNNDTDDGKSLTAFVVSGLQHGTLDFREDGKFAYDPNPDFFGTDAFTYKVHDGVHDSNTATVRINVSNLEDIPVGAADFYSVSEDSALFVPAAEGVLDNDFDPDLESLTALLVTSPIYGELTLNDDGSFRYVPSPNFNGTDFFV